MTIEQDIAKLTTYRDLLVAIEPRTITSAAQAEEYRALIDRLTDSREMSQAQRDIVGLLGQLVYDWEVEHEEPIEATPQEVVASLLEANGLPQSALVGPVFPNRHVVSDFLAGRRALSYDRAARLAAFFHVSPAVFYPRGYHPVAAR
jgi:HTH-type transcriptional regulator/antitoxin HigA